MENCVKCGLPALDGSDFCRMHQYDSNGNDILAKGAGAGFEEVLGSRQAALREGKLLGENFGPSPKDIG